MGRLISFVGITVIACASGLAQVDSSRQIIPEEFVKARASKSRTAPKEPARYRDTSGRAAQTQSNYQQLGLTLWRLRPAKTTDVGARILVQASEEMHELTAERISADTPLKLGEKIRLSFESPREGFLYVFDREKYADGSLGNPVMIFPTLRTRNGDNKVAPGRIIEIPAQDDQPNYFSLKQNRPDQTEEVLTVIVTEKPLDEVSIERNAKEIAPALLLKWERQWGAKAEKFELVNGVGRQWTRAEQQAGADASRQLTQEEPGPQTIYRVATPPSAPILVRVGLRYLRNVRR